MKSIKTKFLMIAMFSMILIAAITSTASVLIVNSISKRDSAIMMNEISNSNAEKLNRVLESLSQAVDVLSLMAMDDISSATALHKESYMYDYMKSMQKNFISVASHTQGAKSVYYRLNPDIAGDGMGGFFWTKRDDVEGFVQQKPTDLLAYSEEDMDYVGWYYEPVRKGEGTWIPPYYNKNIDVYMISYAVPCYYKGEFVGVVGMDIDFNDILAQTLDLEIYKDGYIKIACIPDETVYSLYEENITKEELLPDLKRVLIKDKAENELFECDKDGVKYTYTYGHVVNGFVVVVYVPVANINLERNRLLINIVMSVLVTFVIVLSITVVYIEKIVKPLTMLTESMEKFTRGEGEYKKLIIDSGDEIGKLSKNYVIMIDTIKENIDKVNNYARHDGLTGLGNKAYYLELVDEIKFDAIGEWANYGILVFDLNFLKKANDVYGHETGDALIIQAAKYIEKAFKSSRSFRMGGDEFITILCGEDYDNRSLLLEKFEKGLVNNIVDEEKSIYLSIAYGMAVCPDDGTDYDELFRLADKRMYDNKIKQKAQRQMDNRF